jgi:hypothetical protein
MNLPPYAHPVRAKQPRTPEPAPNRKVRRVPTIWPPVGGRQGCQFSADAAGVSPLWRRGGGVLTGVAVDAVDDVAMLYRV